MDGIQKYEAGYCDACATMFYTSPLNMTWYKRSKKILLADLEQAEGHDRMFVYLSAGRPAGYIRYSLTGVFGCFPFLNTLVVDGNFRRQGIGTSLVAHMLQDIVASGKWNSKMFLTVIEENQAAREFYRSLDFMEAGRLPDLYRPGVAELLLVKQVRATDKG